MLTGEMLKAWGLKARAEKAYKPKTKINISEHKLRQVQAYVVPK